MMDRLAVAEHDYKSGRVRQALQLFQSELAANPDSALAHQGTGRCLYRLGRYEDAANECRRAIELNSQLAPARTILAYVYYREGNIAESEREARNAIHLDPSQSEAHAHLGALLESRGKLDEAVASLETAIRLDDSNWYAHYILGLSMSRLRRHRGSLTELSRAMKLKPSAVAVPLLLVEFVTAYGIWVGATLTVVTMAAFVLRSGILLAIAIGLPAFLAVSALLGKKWIPAAAGIAWCAFLAGTFWLWSGLSN